jgi:hypothetical protein
MINPKLGFNSAWTLFGDDRTIEIAIDVKKSIKKLSRGRFSQEIFFETRT